MRLVLELVDKPDHWRERADEVRAIAKEMNDAGLKVTMLRLAGIYDRLAGRAQRLALNRGKLVISSRADLRPLLDPGG